jgi:hypothetical protein
METIVRMSEDGKDRRHKERMEMGTKLLQKLDKVLEKCRNIPDSNKID